MHLDNLKFVLKYVVTNNLTVKQLYFDIKKHRVYRVIIDVIIVKYILSKIQILIFLCKI